MPLYKVLQHFGPFSHIWKTKPLHSPGTDALQFNPNRSIVKFDKVRLPNSSSVTPSHYTILTGYLSPYFLVIQLKSLRQGKYFPQVQNSVWRKNKQTIFTSALVFHFQYPCLGLCRSSLYPVPLWVFSLDPMGLPVNKVSPLL